MMRPFVMDDVDDLHRLWVNPGADPPNVASFRVIEKLGMKFSRKMVVNGLDVIYYAICRDDYKIHLELDSKLDVK